MPSESLIEFHKRRFPDGTVPLYSKQTFFALVEEISELEQNSDMEDKNHEIKKKSKKPGEEP